MRRSINGETGDGNSQFWFWNASRYENTMCNVIWYITSYSNGRDIMNLLTTKSVFNDALLRLCLKLLTEMRWVQWYFG